MRIPRSPPSLTEIMADPEFQAEFGTYFQREDVMEFVRGANELYLYWDEVRYRPKPQGTTYELLWAAIQSVRQFDRRDIMISKIDGFTFHYSLNAKMSHLLHTLDVNLGGPGAGGALGRDADRERYLIGSLMEEAIASSQIEGAATSRKVAKDMLRKGRKPRNRSERMIINNYRSMKMLLNLKDNELTPDMLLDIQSSMTDGTLDDQEDVGAFRHTNDVVVSDRSTGQVFYTPPDHHHLPQLISDLCTFANTEDQEPFIHPIIRASFLHFLVGYIHPFVDGNGRTARAWFYWSLLKDGYWLMEFMPISRIIVDAPSRYARAYLHTEKDGNDFSYFLLYMLEKMSQAMTDLKVYLERQEEKRKDESFIELAENSTLNLRQVRILEWYLSHPTGTMTIDQVRTMFDVAYQTARTDLMGLESMALIESRKGRWGKLLFSRRKDFKDAISPFLAPGK